jgi:hypothetical protein
MNLPIVLVLKNYYDNLKIITFGRVASGEGKTMYMFSVSVNAFSIEFPLACYQQAGRVWYISGLLRRTYTLFYPHPGSLVIKGTFQLQVLYLRPPNDREVLWTLNKGFKNGIKRSASESNFIYLTGSLQSRRDLQKFKQFRRNFR